MFPAEKHCSCRDYLDDTIPFQNYRIGEFAIACLDARDGGAVPVKQLLRPEIFPACLPHVWLYEYDADRNDYVCRLAGEKAQAAVGVRMLGTGLADLVTADAYPAVLGRWNRAVTTQACIYGTYELARINGAGGRSERLIMPLKSADGRANMLFGVSIFNVTENYFNNAEIPTDEVNFFELKDFPN